VARDFSRGATPRSPPTLVRLRLFHRGRAPGPPDSPVPGLPARLYRLFSLFIGHFRGWSHLGGLLFWPVSASRVNPSPGLPGLLGSPGPRTPRVPGLLDRPGFPRGSDLPISRSPGLPATGLPATGLPATGLPISCPPGLPASPWRRRHLPDLRPALGRPPLGPLTYRLSDLPGLPCLPGLRGFRPPPGLSASRAFGPSDDLSAFRDPTLRPPVPRPPGTQTSGPAGLRALTSRPRLPLPSGLRPPGPPTSRPPTYREPRACGLRPSGPPGSPRSLAPLGLSGLPRLLASGAFRSPGPRGLRPSGPPSSRPPDPPDPGASPPQFLSPSRPPRVPRGLASFGLAVLFVWFVSEVGFRETAAG